MTIFDQVILLLTGLVAIFLIINLVKKQKDAGTSGPGNIYFIISFAVLLVSGLLLIFLGWDVLANKLIAIVAGLIPFCLALGLVSKFFPDSGKWYLGLMVIGLILIAVTRLADLTLLGKIVYPVFHAIAGLTIFALPIYGIKKEKVKGTYVFVTIGAALIGLGGIALVFLKAGTQLLFFSADFVFMILAPLLFLMALSFAIGIVWGEK